MRSLILLEILMDCEQTEYKGVFRIYKKLTAVSVELLKYSALKSFVKCWFQMLTVNMYSWHETHEERFYVL